MERTIDIIQSSALPLFWALLKMTIPLTLISFALGNGLGINHCLSTDFKKSHFKWNLFPICLGLPRNAFISPIIYRLFWTPFCRNPNGRMDCSDFDFFIEYRRVCF